MNAALAGDLQACKILLDRISPPLKAQAAPIEIELPLECDLTKMAEVLIRASAGGYLSRDVGAQLVSAVSQLARITAIKEDLPKPEEDRQITQVNINIIDPNGYLNDGGNEDEI